MQFSSSHRKGSHSPFLLQSDLSIQRNGLWWLVIIMSCNSSSWSSHTTTEASCKTSTNSAWPSKDAHDSILLTHKAKRSRSWNLVLMQALANDMRGLSGVGVLQPGVISENFSLSIESGVELLSTTLQPKTYKVSCHSHPRLWYRFLIHSAAIS